MAACRSQIVQRTKAVVAVWWDVLCCPRCIEALRLPSVAWVYACAVGGPRAAIKQWAEQGVTLRRLVSYIRRSVRKNGFGARPESETMLAMRRLHICVCAHACVRVCLRGD